MNSSVDKISGALHPQSPHPNPLASNMNEHYASSNDGDSDIYASTTHPDAPVEPHLPSRPSYTNTDTLRPFHHLAHKLGSESPLPQDLASEIQKATRILQAFTNDPAVPLTPLPRVYPPSAANETQRQSTVADETRKNHTLLPIPPSVISSCIGLAIFSSVRLGFHASLSTGSGILIRRLPDGSWSPPSAIGVHALGAGFVFGGDMSDVVVVINTEDAMEAFMRAKVTLGPEVAVAAGPYGAGGGVGVVVEGCKRQQHNPASAVETGNGEKGAQRGEEDYVSEKQQLSKAERREREKAAKKAAREARKAAAYAAVKTALRRPVFTYVRSRGLYAGLQVDGTILTERADTNEKFYGVKTKQELVLKGHIPRGSWAGVVRPLYELLNRVERGAAMARSAGMAAADPSSERREQQQQVKSEGGHRRRQDEEWEELPKYEDDGNTRPGVGDLKEGQN